MSEDTARPPVQNGQEQPGPPVLEPGYTYASVTDKISAITLSRGTPRGWWMGFGLAFLLVGVLSAVIDYKFGHATPEVSIADGTGQTTANVHQLAFGLAVGLSR